jgi:hypothetical protein
MSYNLGFSEWFLFKTSDIDKAIKKAHSYIQEDTDKKGFTFKFSRDHIVTVRDYKDFSTFRNTVLELMEV